MGTILKPTHTERSPMPSSETYTAWDGRMDGKHSNLTKHITSFKPIQADACQAPIRVSLKCSELEQFPRPPPTSVSHTVCHLQH